MARKQLWLAVLALGLPGIADPKICPEAPAPQSREKAVETATGWLRTGDTDQRLRAIQYLGKIADGGQFPVLHMVSLLRTSCAEWPGLTSALCEALRHIGEAQVLPQLEKAVDGILRQTSWNENVPLFEVVAVMSTKTNTLCRALEENLSSPELRESSSLVIRALIVRRCGEVVDEGKRELVRDIEAKLKGGDDEAMCCAAYALRLIAPIGKEAVGEVAKLLRRRECVLAAMASLAAFGEGARQTIDVLRECGQDSHADSSQAVSICAAFCCARLAGYKNAELSAALKAAGSDLDRSGYWALGWIVDFVLDTGAIGAICRYLRSDDKAVMRGALRMVRQLGTRAEDASTELVKLLKSPDPEMRGLAAEALGTAGMGAEVKDALATAIAVETNVEAKAAMSDALNLLALD